MGIRVECYAGYRGEEIPRVFFLGKRRIRVEEALALGKLSFDPQLRSALT